jgi:pantoate--beta-alanine ligase
MRIVRSVSELRAALLPARLEGRSIGLVPTMGAFHDGHLSLMRRARERSEVVVVSLFVNPTQFNDAADLAAYPRDELRDIDLAAEQNVDYLFAPPAGDVYPPGFATTVSIAGLTDVLEGAHRGHRHFDGVTTVVTKLLNMVGPDVAYFGQKDAQQAIIVRRLVGDLDMPVRIEICPTVRDADGLALSSRNSLLSNSDRERATYLHRALERVRATVLAGAQDPQVARAAGLEELSMAGIEPDYLELVDAETLAPVQRINGEVLVVIAARVGGTRLIDNDLIVTGERRTGALEISCTTRNEVATPLGASTTAQRRRT